MSAVDSVWLSAALGASGTAVIGVDTQGRTVFWSAGAEALFGWDAQSVIGLVPPIVPLPLLQEWQLQMRRVLDSGESTAAAETQRLTRDGRLIWVVRLSSPVRDEGGQVIGLVDTLVDISALKQLDDESRALAQVRERELIAMDLHDGLIQSLYGVVLNLAAAETQSGPSLSEGAVQALRLGRTEIERVIEETRHYVLDLRARGFTPRSVTPGLKLLADGLRLNAGLDAVQLRADPQAESALAPETRGHLLYLAREAVSNVLRHAGATRVRISLARTPRSVALRILDNGRGFDPARVSSARQRGLHNMAERARLVGGRLEIRSRLGHGTAIRVRVPTSDART